MSQQKKLEQVLDLLLSEDSDHAAEILHQIIVEKARTIYESIVDEEETEEEDKERTDTEAEMSHDFVTFCDMSHLSRCFLCLIASGLSE